MQHSLDDLWVRYPPLLDEDLHGELAPETTRVEAIARRPDLHQQRLEHVAQELERPGVIPIVTITFAAICVIAFVWQLWYHGPFPDTTDIESVGGLREGLDGGWWRFWTANALHVSVQHLTGNLLVWALIATLLERVVGHARMVGLIIFGAAGCSAGALIAHPDIVGVGASGVVFAAFGMAAMIDPIARRAVGKLGWSLVAFGLGLSTFAPGVSSGGHVGGVIAGFIFGAFVMLVWRVRRPLVTAGDRAARRRPVVDRSAPLAADREQTIAERLAHLDRRRELGALAPEEHERLRRALVTRG
jgi:membrane associated rhomboid family serine protease